MDLTIENYHSDEANAEYLSVSQLKDFEACPYNWYYTFRLPHFEKVQTVPMLVGSYVDTKWLTPRLFDNWCITHEKEIWGVQGRLYKNGPQKGTNKPMLKDFIRADHIVEVIKAQPSLMSLLEISKQQFIITGTFAGAPFKCMLDSVSFTTLDDEPWLMDLKTTANFLSKWNEKKGCRESWHRKLWFQLAVYRFLLETYDESTSRKVLIVGATREPEPDLAFIELDDDDAFAKELVHATELTNQILKYGDDLDWIHEHACGTCSGCRRHKSISGPVKVNCGPEDVDQIRWSRYKMIGMKDEEVKDE